MFKRYKLIHVKALAKNFTLEHTDAMVRATAFPVLHYENTPMQYTVKILLNARTLINAHPPILMPQMAILSARFGVPGTSN